jgi:hypothetical protein
MKRGSAAALLAAVALLAGCSQIITTGSQKGFIARGAADTSASYTLPATPLVPNATLQLTPSYGITLESMLYGVAIYYFVDPLAPNWQFEIRRLSLDTYGIAMRSKRFRSSGGDGESSRVFRRNAAKIVREGGFADYTLLAYSTGIESETLGAVRVAEGVIRVER